MIKPEQIPDEVVNAASKAYELYIYDSVSDEGMRLAIAAALNAWPGMKACEEDDLGPACLILPLPQEKNDE